MSRRTSPVSGVNAPHVKQLQKELSDLKSATLAASADDSVSAAATGIEASQVPSFDSLTRTEQAAASLGVAPESWKPIAFMNVRCNSGSSQMPLRYSATVLTQRCVNFVQNAHYEALVKSNAIDDTLARRIEVRFRTACSPFFVSLAEPCS